MRMPIGSVMFPGALKKIDPSASVFGTVFVSTTRTHCVQGVDAKYSAAACISSGVRFFAKPIIWFTLTFRGSPGFLRPFLKSLSVCRM